MPRDYYEVLGVARNASDGEIKTAYRKLAREHHPDRNPGDDVAAARFKEIQEAYDVLSDKSKREKFDRFGHAGPQGFGGFHTGQGAEGFAEGVDLEDLLRQFGGGMGGGVNVEDLGDIFGGRSRNSGRRRPPRALEQDIAVPFMTMAQGGTIGLRIEGREVEVKVPAGAQDGTKLRVRGQGPSGSDLIVVLRIQPHPWFKMDGKDVLLELPITIGEAVLGAKIEVPTVKGDILTVTIKPGTSTGSRSRLPGFGIGGGDQYLVMKIVAPTNIDDESRELMKKFVDNNPQNPRAGGPWDRRS